MSKKSTRIALGGMFSALCLVLMFMTGIIPFATYAIPALAGATLIPVMVENGRKAAVLVYVTVSILSIFIVPNPEASMMFIALLGYYPIAKSVLDLVRPGVLRILLKLVLFNAAVIAGYYMVIVVLGIPDMSVEGGDWGRYAVLGMLAAGNLVFLIYDFALARYTQIYIRWFKPTFLRR